jgi:DNA-binding HxlR family transcriptional regulator
VTSGWEHINDEDCRHFQTAVELVGKRWSSAILLAMARGATRFGEIRALVDGLSDRMLAERMRELQTAKLLEREVVPSTPVQIRYHLTDRGVDLIRSMQPLVKWGHRWQDPLLVESKPAAASKVRTLVPNDSDTPA